MLAFSFSVPAIADNTPQQQIPEYHVYMTPNYMPCPYYNHNNGPAFVPPGYFWGWKNFDHGKVNKQIYRDWQRNGYYPHFYHHGQPQQK